MHEIGYAVIALLAMLGCFGAGMLARRVLHERHRSHESIEAIRVVLTLLVTCAALVLGLLISGAKIRFDENGAGARALGIDITELDQQLREYGPQLDPLRADLIRYASAAIATTWPSEPPPPGTYPRQLQSATSGSVESPELGGILSGIDLALRDLDPETRSHRALAASLRARSMALQQQRWDLIAEAAPSLSWPFLAMLIFWLSAIFGLIGFSSPQDRVLLVVTGVAAVSIASAIYLIVDLDTPLTGVLQISSAPLRDALRHLMRPPLPLGAL
jgi:hypothetical protein